MFVSPLMYPRSKFLEVLLNIRCEMAAEADHDVDEFVQNLRVPSPSSGGEKRDTGPGLNGDSARPAGSRRKQRGVPSRHR